jgi:hypothetical protein
MNVQVESTIYLDLLQTSLKQLNKEILMERLKLFRQGNREGRVSDLPDIFLKYKGLRGLS